MIDLHCHLLPGIDDGAADMEQALGLARAAIEDGITHAVATPHIHIGRYANTRDSIAQLLGEFRQALLDAQIPLEVSSAAEVRLSDDLPALVERDQLPFVGEWQGDRLLLLELPHSHIPPGVERIIDWLYQRNIRALIAHPERNRGILRDVDLVRPLAQRGCLFQVTAGAVTGGFGPPAQQRARQLLERNLVTVLASDAHHLVRRPPLMTEGRRAAEAVVGESRSLDLVLHHPATIAEVHFHGIREAAKESFTPA
ncbi:CpsB/CapC family capsule biosynthesis tyrosine phosphatase [Microbulbifer sp. SAOS-129_SWC]|uniref:tyrosine-protein phosphatase n=1 Tax=Microbulbifer sp. SAOS-129_SWC TaxID=3145235 RepID=UPI003216B87C